MKDRFVILLLGASLAGWMPIADAAGGVQVASLAPAHIDFGFDYEKSLIHASNHVEQKLETKNYLVRSLSFPSIGENGQAGNLVRALYYQSKLPGKKKLVIVLPIWGTHTYPSRKITKSLVRNSRGDINVLRILGKDSLFDWAAMRAAATEEELITLAERMVERVRTHVVDIRRAIDWAETQPDIDMAFLMMSPLGFNTMRRKIYDFLDETLRYPPAPLNTPLAGRDRRLQAGALS